MPEQKEKAPRKGPSHEASFSNIFYITRLHICLHPMVLLSKCLKWLNVISHCAGSSPAFGTMEIESHLKVAFLLQKLRLTGFVA